MKGLERSAAARGGLLSGSTLKGIQRFGQDLGSQEYQNAFNRYQTERNARLNPLQSLAGFGQTSTNQLGAAGQNYATGAGEALGGGTTGGESGAYDMGQGLDVMSGGPGQVAGTAGATAAPITDATVVTPEQTYPGVEKGAFTPAPGSLQATLPELGVQTAASAPYTAIPGSIEAMLAGTPIAGANPAISVQDAFRGARMIQGLLNRPQQPQTNPYMLMNQQQQPGLVSYEELLGLLNRPMASTPNVYQTLAPSQNPYSLI
jgi:hypothetical protein